MWPPDFDPDGDLSPETQLFIEASVVSSLPGLRQKSGSEVGITTKLSYVDVSRLFAEAQGFRWTIAH